MSLPPLPNLAGVLLDRWLATAGITALVDDRIATELQDDWFPSNSGQHAILLNGPVGSPANNLYLVGMQRTRYDVFFFGVSYTEAMTLWRTAHPYICPEENVAFIQGGVRVTNVRKEGGPSRVPDTIRKWPAILATYVWDYSERPASL